jgi:hypothetical protein
MSNFDNLKLHPAKDLAAAAKNFRDNNTWYYMVVNKINCEAKRGEYNYTLPEYDLLTTEQLQRFVHEGYHVARYVRDRKTVICWNQYEEPGIYHYQTLEVTISMEREPDIPTLRFVEENGFLVAKYDPPSAS